jgi:hypothetical protein
MWQGDHWQAILMNPFVASMAPIPEAVAAQTAGRHLHDPPTHQELPGGEVVELHATPVAARNVTPGVVEP